MTNLEFVESRIKFFEEKIKEEEQEFKMMKTEDKHIISYYNKHIDILKEKKKIFEQIKTELEAWEVVKRYVKEISINGIVFEHIINVSHTKQNYEVVKKALEVEDEE